jgi:hypothetical protein
MQRQTLFLVLAVIMLSAELLGAAENPEEKTDLEAFAQRSHTIQRNGMIALGSWAAINAVGGGVLALTTAGAPRSFALMSMGWGGVNGALALTAGTTEAPPADLEALLRRQRRLENLFLFNAGLDVGYMFAGLWMTRLADSRNSTGTQERLKGFGYSIVMQGAFLFVFDLVMFLIHHGHGQALYGQL